MTFYFYDLETSGFKPREARIMQFAGQRTDMNLKTIGEPDNILVKMTSDALPDPDAVLVHGITPQHTIGEGMGEAELVKYLTSKVFVPDTIAVGFNSIRFDDEFMRFMLWRNFTDAYEWTWKDGRSRWDLLDVARMTRALRPEGIEWPFAPDGRPSNRLELLASVNKLEHANAHDALSDVRASIELARLIRGKQAELFDYLFKIRGKQPIRALVESGKPFMYTSGRYPSEYLHTTAAVLLGRAAEKEAALVYDLRYDPEPYLKMSTDELVKAWQWTKDPEAVRLPVKTLKYNRCPAILPGVVKDKKTLERLQLNREDIAKNLQKISKNGQEFANKLFKVVERLDEERNREQISMVADQQKVDEQLYDGFIDGPDKTKMSVVRAADATGLADLQLDFGDERLKLLLLLYKARNYPKSLNPEEQEQWENFRKQRLLDGGEASRAARFFRRLGELQKQAGLSAEQRYLLEELNLYGQSLVPAE